jgi:tetratricopeptide (TPR) repeat protein
MSVAMSVPLSQRFVAACILGLGVCLASSAQDKPPEKQFPSGSEVADLLKKEPITLETWMVWRPRLLEWISDRGKGTDPAFEAGRKFARSQANDKEELNAPVAKDALAWYLLGGAYFEEVEGKPTPDQLAGYKRAEKALRQSIKLDDKFAFSHRKLAQVLMAEEDIEPGEEKDLSKLTPRLAEASRELDEAARLEARIDLSGLRYRLGKLLYQQDRYAPADAQLLQALKEETTPSTPLLTDASMAVLRNPKRNYNDTLSALKEMQDKYPTEPVIPFVRGLTLIEAGLPDKAQESFATGMAMKTADPAKLIPTKEVYTIVDKIIRNEKTSWPMAANQLTVLAINWSEDPNIASAHALVRYKADDYGLAASEIARARKLGGKPEQIFQQFLRISPTMVPDIEFAAVQNRLTVGFTWMLGVIITLFGIGLAWLTFAAPRSAPATTTGSGTPGKSSAGGPLVLAVAIGIAAVLFMIMDKAVGLSPRSSVVLTGAVLLAGVILVQRKRQSPIWPEQVPALSSWYALTMLAGVGLFYAALLFLFVGLVVLIGGVIFLLLSSPNLSLILFIELLVVGVLAWMFVSMLISPPPKEIRGIVVDAADIGRLRLLVDEVTRKLEADPIKDIRITVGSAVALTMIGKGPLGLLGGSRPTLVIGYTALRLLSTAELQTAIAQQLAPLSRKEDAWGRTVYCSWLAMLDTLDTWSRQKVGISGISLFSSLITGGMGFGIVWGSGGLNPFFYIMSGYFWVFNQLVGPFIRGQMAHADQTAAKLNGAGALESAMLKMHADGLLFQARLEELVKQLLDEEPDDLGNMYAAWDELCADSTTPAQQAADVQPASVLRDLNFALLAVGPRERNQARRWALDFKGPTPYGLPTLGQRISSLPVRSKGKKETYSTDITTGDVIRKDDTKSASTELLDNAEGIEEKLTEFFVPAPTPASQVKPAEAAAPVK